MKIDDKVLEVCAEAVCQSLFKKPLVNLFEAEQKWFNDNNIRVATQAAITAYLKETQPTADHIADAGKMVNEPSHDKYQDYINKIVEATINGGFVKVEYVSPDELQKPKAEVNELVGEIDRQVVELENGYLTKSEEEQVIDCLKRCKNFIEGNYSKISNSSNGE